MQFNIGQVVVHPHHGPATITEIFSRTIGKTETEYLRLAVHHSDLVVAVPSAMAEEVGLRELCDADQLARLVEILHAPTGDEQTAWSRRFKENQEKLRHGDLFVTAGVVRDLTRREHDTHLSLGERSMLRSARESVVAELSLVLSSSEDQIETLVDEAILATGADNDAPALV